MFNLLVTGSAGWNPSRDTIAKNRALEYTDRHIRQRFSPNKLVDFAKLTELPTVFACENAWDGTQPSARIGTLIRVREAGGDLDLEYIFDSDLPPIPNSVLFGSAAAELRIDITSAIPEYSRNHWSVKDVDLYKVLLKHGLTQRSKPKVFSFTDEPVDDELVAVMMPFATAFGPVYGAIQRAVAECGLRCQRADDIWENDHIIQDMALLLSKAAVVICDLSGRNANVFYEAGIAHALGREVVLLAQSPSDIPFDVAAIRHVQYLPNSEGLKKLSEDLANRLQTLKSRR